MYHGICASRESRQMPLGSRGCPGAGPQGKAADWCIKFNRFRRKLLLSPFRTMRSFRKLQISSPPVFFSGGGGQPLVAVVSVILVKMTTKRPGCRVSLKILTWQDYLNVMTRSTKTRKSNHSIITRAPSTSNKLPCPSHAVSIESHSPQSG